MHLRRNSVKWYETYKKIWISEESLQNDKKRTKKGNSSWRNHCGMVGNIRKGKEMHLGGINVEY
jgi:hypothetical protein